MANPSINIPDIYGVGKQIALVDNGDGTYALQASSDKSGGPSGVTPVTGAFSGVGQSVSLTPVPKRGFNITLTGTFVASVQLERSFDNGVSYVPLTANSVPLLRFTGPVSESWEEAETPVLYRLRCTNYTSGTINYRISQ